MKKLVFAALCSLSLLLAAAAPALAQAKIKIAIWDFETFVQGSYWFQKDLGPAARNQIDTAFSENPLLSAKFSVIEREKLALVMKEQGLAATGAIDPQSAAKVGKLLGVRYVVTGAVDKFSINTTRGSLGGFGGNQTTADASISIRFIDTTTAERVISIAESGQVKKGGASFRGTSLSRDAEWGIASEAVQKASKAVVDKLTATENLDKVSAAAGDTGGIDARIAQVDGKTAVINMGASAGIKVGDKFKIFSVGADIIDPVTGAKLGAMEKEIGSGVVTDVQDRFAVIAVTGTATVGAKIKKQ
jgi:curli biogenesis system outer membrane secretion channel CsgG